MIRYGTFPPSDLSSNRFSRARGSQIDLNYDSVRYFPPSDLSSNRFSRVRGSQIDLNYDPTAFLRPTLYRSPHLRRAYAWARRTQWAARFHPCFGIPLRGPLCTRPSELERHPGVRRKAVPPCVSDISRNTTVAKVPEAARVIPSGSLAAPRSQRSPKKARGPARRGPREDAPNPRGHRSVRPP